MFSIDQIKEAHAKVKSGADFPAYVQDLIKLGIASYITYVSDGHTRYFGKENYSIQSDARYPPMKLAKKSDQERFRYCLKIHQEGQTDYPTFCKDAAATGVEKWVTDLDKMTCTYFDLSGNKMLVEKIPQS
jgi:uncharacterized protein YbcV (DUF1398 family)